MPTVNSIADNTSSSIIEPAAIIGHWSFTGHWSLVIGYFLIALCLMAPISGRAATQKKLIEFGWDEPDTRFMREHAAEMEQSPFDGCVFHMDARKPDGGSKGSFTWGAWGTRIFTEEELRAGIDDLKAAKF